MLPSRTYPEEVVGAERLHLQGDGFDVMEVRGIETRIQVAENIAENVELIDVPVPTSKPCRADARRCDARPQPAGSLPHRR
ncbi:hypothetical protein GCM10027062_17490 [Nocardioides hungaricus]